ncbi:musculin [Nothobranchius furzeri]|uniref:Musculin n=1 Tax=Nothobranchius furzeri TaxID=105023 RepID=A0A8C6LPD4_NOTFU|nr:musculin [Nothobranchius furzeri]
MSTGSATSDAEDNETRDRIRLKRTITRHGSGEDLEDDTAKRIVEQSRSGRISKARLKEARQTQRNAANARERARMRVLSRAFSRLKTSLPWVPADTKLSKLDTLRLASSYISHLRQLLQEDHFENNFAHPVNLTWPFLTIGRSDDDVTSTVRL